MQRFFKFPLWGIGLFLMVLSPIKAAEKSGLIPFDGSHSQLEQHLGEGKWSLVVLWAHDCHVCRLEAKHYAEFHKKNRNKQAQVIGISIDGERHKKEAEAFVKTYDLPFPNLLAEVGDVATWHLLQTKTQFRGTPTLFIYSPTGEIKAAQAGAVSIEAIEKFIAKNSQ